MHHFFVPDLDSFLNPSDETGTHHGLLGGVLRKCFLGRKLENGFGDPKMILRKLSFTEMIMGKFL
jgi:hypothetical protein